MATYVQTGDNSDLTPSWPNTSIFDKDMVTGAAGEGQFGQTVPLLAIRSAAFITIAGVPNNDAMEDGGTQTVELDVRMGDADFTGKCRIVRLDSAGNIEEFGAFTGTQVLSAGANPTFSPVAPTWGTSGDAEDCGDRLAIEFEIENTDNHNHTLELRIRQATAEVITDITENGGSCGAEVVDNLFFLGII